MLVSCLFHHLDLVTLIRRNYTESVPILTIPDALYKEPLPHHSRRVSSTRNPDTTELRQSFRESINHYND